MKEISAAELRRILCDGAEKNVAVIDVRSRAEYTAECIPNVRNIPLDEIERHIGELKSYDAVYLQCQSGRRSAVACEKLVSLGLANIVNVQGGLISWKACGFGTQCATPGRMPLFQQVLLSAGSLILLGFALFWLVHPYFLLLPLAVGCGLTFAGATGKCFMMWLLGKMPWNR